MEEPGKEMVEANLRLVISIAKKDIRRGYKFANTVRHFRVGCDAPQLCTCHQGRLVRRTARQPSG